MRQRLAKWMMGRNGMDALNRLLSVLTLIVLIVSMFVHGYAAHPVVAGGPWPDRDLFSYALAQCLSPAAGKRRVSAPEIQGDERVARGC